MIQGLGNLLGVQQQPQNQTLGALQGLGTLLGAQQQPQNSTLGAIQGIGNLLGMGQNTQSQSPLSLLTGGLRCSQNENRLMQEKQQRNILKKYLTQQTGDPIKSALISNTIPGRGALDDFDVGLGTRSSIMSQLGLSNMSGPAQNQSLLSSIGNLGTLANLGRSSTADTGLLSSLVSLAGSSNNNANILSSLGGLGTGLMGNSNSGGVLGSIQSGINTLNTINKVNNAVNSVRGIFG